MKLIITIDTEEDRWGSYERLGNACENVRKIPILQQIFDNYGVKPTYLVTFPVAHDRNARSILKEILANDSCEIGTHCHPWNTPPFQEDLHIKNTLLCNLPSDLIYKKIRYLHETIVHSFSVEPVSFRAGRWGYDRKVAKSIHKLNYKIDTSITPLFDWSANYGPNFSRMLPNSYRFSPENILEESPDGELFEVPTTIGFSQRNYKVTNQIYQICRRRPLASLRLIGMLYRLKIVNRVWLSPELSTCNQMINLTKNLIKNDYQIFNMMFHSSSLSYGINPFVITKTDEERFLKRIEKYLIFARGLGMKSITLSEALASTN